MTYKIENQDSVTIVTDSGMRNTLAKAGMTDEQKKKVDKIPDLRDSLKKFADEMPIEEEPGAYAPFNPALKPENQAVYDKFKLIQDRAQAQQMMKTMPEAPGGITNAPMPIPEEPPMPELAPIPKGLPVTSPGIVAPGLLPSQPIAPTEVSPAAKAIVSSALPPPAIIEGEQPSAKLGGGPGLPTTPAVRPGEGEWFTPAKPVPVQAKPPADLTTMQGRLGAEQQAYDQFAEATTKAHQEAQKKVAEQQAKIDQWKDDIDNYTVSPDNFWSGHPTGRYKQVGVKTDKFGNEVAQYKEEVVGGKSQFQKIAMIIGAAMISGASARNHGDPAAGWKVIESQINQDLRAQEIELQKRQGLAKEQVNVLGEMRKEFKDNDIARDAVLQLQLRTIDRGLAEAREKARSQEAKDRYDLLSQQVKARGEKAAEDQAFRTLQKQKMANDITLQEQRISGRNLSAQDKQQIDRADNLNSMIDKFQEAIDNGETDPSAIATRFFPGSKAQSFDQLRQLFVNEYAHMMTGAQAGEKERARYEGALSKSWVPNAMLKSQLEALRTNVNTKRDAIVQRGVGGVYGLQGANETGAAGAPQSKSYEERGQ